MEPRVSIIIPHYNIPDLLLNLLESIPPNNEIQVIVVDDKSTKQIEQYEGLVSRFSRSNVEFYRNEGKNSAGRCRNVGLDHAKGEWIMFADADDFFNKGWYEIVKRLLDTDYDMIRFCSSSYNLDENRPDPRHEIVDDFVMTYLDNPTPDNMKWLCYHVNAVWSALYRRSFLDAHNIRFEPVMYGNDVAFSTLCAYHVKKFGCFRDEIYCVTRRSNSLTTTFSAEADQIRKEVAIRRLGFLYRNLTPEEIHNLGLGSGDFAPIKLLNEVRKNPKTREKLPMYRRMMRNEKVPAVNWKYILMHPIEELREIIKKLAHK